MPHNILNLQRPSKFQLKCLFQIVQIGRILNAHMNSLQWIDQNTALIATHLEQVSKLHDVHRRENERSFHLTYDWKPSVSVLLCCVRQCREHAQMDTRMWYHILNKLETILFMYVTHDKICIYNKMYSEVSFSLNCHIP